MTESAERQAEYRKRRILAGNSRHTFWLTQESRIALMQLAIRLNESEAAVLNKLLQSVNNAIGNQAHQE
jgi:hypothetical protein